MVAVPRSPLRFKLLPESSCPKDTGLNMAASAPAIISASQAAGRRDREGQRGHSLCNFNLYFSLEHVSRAIAFIYCDFLPFSFLFFFLHRVVDFLICFWKLYIRYINAL